MRRNLKAERVKAGISLKDFCKTTGLSISLVSDIEAGRKDGTYKTWTKIQKALQVENTQMWDLYLKQK